MSQKEFVKVIENAVSGRLSVNETVTVSKPVARSGAAGPADYVR